MYVAYYVLSGKLVMGACCMLYLKLIKIRVSARWEMNASQHVLRNIYLSLYRSME